MNKYEQERMKNIQKNKEMLKELGFINESNISTPPDFKKQPNRKYSQKKLKREANAIIPRSSRRVRGESADTNITATFEEIPLVIVKQLQESPTIRMPENIYLPLTLTSIGVTIWNMGTLVSDHSRNLYWSKKGCKYRHQYPVGFKSTKYHFGREWTCSIDASADGPIFKVTDNLGKNYSGISPTAPWTDVCLAFTSKHGGTRISGPLHFGFSDPIVIALIERMENYISFDDFNSQENSG